MSRWIVCCAGAVSLVACTSRPCPRGQELRQTYFPFSQAVSERGCVAQDAAKTYRLEGRWEFFYRSGQKSAEGTYRDGDAAAERSEAGAPTGGREGLWVEWHDNGQKKSEATYRAGKLEGPRRLWDANGQTTSGALPGNDKPVMK